MLGWLRKTAFSPWTATDIGQLKSLAKQKAGAKKIAKTLNHAPGATTVKAHMRMLDVTRHEGVAEAKVAIISK